MSVRKLGMMILMILAAWRLCGQDTLHVAFTGDIMVHGPQLQAAYQSGEGRYDFDRSFRYVSEYFRRCDATVGNLETTLVPKDYTGYPRFGSPEVLALALRRAGYTHLVTANNHSCDRGRKGIVHTIATLDKIDLPHTGTFRQNDSIPYMIIRKGNIRLAVLNYTYGTNGLPVPAGTVVHRIDTSLIKKHIQLIRRLHAADDIIVFLHWGEQYRFEPTRAQKRLEQFLHRQGIRYIIGAHPHIVQPVNWDRETGRLTAFSLGNFFSNQRDFPRDGGIILLVDWVKDGEKLFIDRVRYVPVWVYKYRKSNHLYYDILPTWDFVIRKNDFKHYGDFLRMARYHLYISRVMKDFRPFSLYFGRFASLPRIWPRDFFVTSP